MQTNYMIWEIFFSDIDLIILKNKKNKNVIFRCFSFWTITLQLQ